MVNTTPQSYKNVKVFAGDKFQPTADASYKNLKWNACEDPEQGEEA